MKTPVAVTLIIMGAILVMAPPLADFLYQRNVVALLANSGVTSVSLAGLMSEIYRLGCWLTGSGMIGIAVYCSLWSRKPSREPSGLAPHGA